MNAENPKPDVDDAIELELKRLKPAKPPLALRARLETALETAGRRGAFYEASPEYRRSRLLRFLYAPLTAAAVVAVALAIVFLQDPGDDAGKGGDGELAIVDVGTDGAFIEPNVARFRPGTARTILFGILDEGVVLNEEDLPVRQFRYQFVESFNLVNPADGSTLRMDIPREEVIRVPVETF